MANKKRVSPIKLFVFVGGTIALASGLSLWYLASFHWLPAYLIAVNFATLALYGHDKWAAIKKWLRVPEKVLHGFALIGGTPFAFIGQRAFRHKTVKGRFRVVFWSMTALQVTLIVWAVWYWELWRTTA